MTKEESARTKKELTDKFREMSIQYQKPVLDSMNVPISHFCVKPGWFVPKGKSVPGISADERIIGLYPNECAKGHDWYMELYDLDFNPLEGRPLFRWKYNPFYMDEIPTFTNASTGQTSFIVSVKELEVINVENVLINGISTFEDVTPAPVKTALSTKSIAQPTEEIVKTISSINTEFSKLTAQEVAAILWRLPISGNQEIDTLIKNYK